MPAKKILLVEGLDDARVIGAILERNNFPEVFSIKSADGIDQLLKQLPVYLKASDIATIGIVVDADFDIDARWQSIRHLMLSGGYKDVPDLPADGGSCFEAAKLPRIGVWLMPDNRLPGMLEDYVRMLIDPADILKTHAEQIVDQLPNCEGRFKDVHKTKAVIHTWLAWRENPGTPMGSAITYRYLSVENEHVAGFSKWLDRIFVK